MVTSRTFPAQPLAPDIAVRRTNQSWKTKKLHRKTGAALGRVMPDQAFLTRRATRPTATRLMPRSMALMPPSGTGATDVVAANENAEPVFVRVRLYVPGVSSKPVMEAMPLPAML